jgi:hypothetical protein
MLWWKGLFWEWAAWGKVRSGWGAETVGFGMKYVKEGIVALVRRPFSFLLI